MPQFEDMIGQKTVLHEPAVLKHTQLIESPLYQNLFASFKEIETTQELDRPTAALARDAPAGRSQYGYAD